MPHSKVRLRDVFWCGDASERITKIIGGLERQKGDHLIFHYKNAKRAVVIPKYDEIPVTIIRNNMKTE
jgi:hypothetical protein